MKLDVQSLSLPGVKLVRSSRISDPRGYFAETFVHRDFAAAEIENQFIQDNQSFSTAVGTIRGLHFQAHPFAQAKLIRVVRGKIFDVVVDLRRSSASYGQHLAIELDARTGDQLFVPAGFAHGCCTLEPDTELFYKVDALYSADHDRGVNWADPTLGIEWPVCLHTAILSEKDRNLPMLKDLPVYFDERVGEPDERVGEFDERIAELV
jgi:dTDP-4-dehydrorhamnose 3,5-epimerase